MTDLPLQHKHIPQRDLAELVDGLNKYHLPAKAIPQSVRRQTATLFHAQSIMGPVPFPVKWLVDITSPDSDVLHQDDRKSGM